MLWQPLWLLLFAAGSGAAVHPNMIMLMGDDMGWGDVGEHGRRPVQP